MKKRIYKVVVIGLDKEFKFDNFERTMAYCKELDFQGYAFELYVYNEFEGSAK